MKWQKLQRDSEITKRERVTYKGLPIRLLAFSAETAGLKGVARHKMLKGKNLHPRIIY